MRKEMEIREDDAEHVVYGQGSRQGRNDRYIRNNRSEQNAQELDEWKEKLVRCVSWKIQNKEGATKGNQVYFYVYFYVYICFLQQDLCTPAAIRQHLPSLGRRRHQAGVKIADILKKMARERERESKQREKLTKMRSK